MPRAIEIKVKTEIWDYAEAINKAIAKRPKGTTVLQVIKVFTTTPMGPKYMGPDTYAVVLLIEEPV